MTDLRNKRILLTGGSGFLGKHVYEKLIEYGVKKNKIRIPRSINHDLRKVSECKKVLKDIDVVIHLAANVGGIGYNQRHPGSLFYDNAIMGINLMHQSMIVGVEKFVAIGTVCAYPKFTPIPFKEENLWNGYPEETNAPYGLAKKMLLVQSQSYRTEYKFNSIYLLPVNLYGPGDNFDPNSSHVIPALIKKFIDAKLNKQDEVEIWGTGTASREFLYAEDAAEGIVLATTNYDSPEPKNLGSGKEISISDLVEKIKKIIGYTGKITYNTNKPDGQPRRSLDTSEAEKHFGFKAKTEFDEGLKKTIDWYTRSKTIQI